MGVTASTPSSEQAMTVQDAENGKNRNVSNCWGLCRNFFGKSYNIPPFGKLFIVMLLLILAMIIITASIQSYRYILTGDPAHVCYGKAQPVITNNYSG